MYTLTLIFVVAFVVSALAMLLFLLIPLIGLSLGSFQTGSFIELLTHTNTLVSLRLSVISATITLCISIICGTPLAYMLANRKFHLRWLIDALLILPIVMPPTVAGVALLSVFGTRGLLGQPILDLFGIRIGFSTTGVILAQTIVAAPFYIKSAISGFESVDKRQLEVAYTLGATRLKAFFKIALPIAYPALLAGASLCWTRAVGELGATLIFAGNLQGQTRTMPLAILTALESAEQGLGHAITLAVILLSAGLFSILAIKFTSYLLTRKRYI